MKCPKYQFENREGAKFCIECGTKLEISHAPYLLIDPKTNHLRLSFYAKLLFPFGKRPVNSIQQFASLLFGDTQQ